MVRPDNDTILDELHEIRAKLTDEMARMSPGETAGFLASQAETILKKWKLELPRANYLLKAVAR